MPEHDCRSQFILFRKIAGKIKSVLFFFLLRVPFRIDISSISLKKDLRNRESFGFSDASIYRSRHSRIKEIWDSKIDGVVLNKSANSRIHKSSKSRILWIKDFAFSEISTNPRICRFQLIFLFLRFRRSENY